MRIALFRYKHIMTNARTCNLNDFIFYLYFTLNIIFGDRFDRKTPKKYFIQIKSHLLVVEFSRNVTF